MARPHEKEQENKQEEHPFEPYVVTLETAETAVLLLLSNEPEVIGQTLHALTKFCSQNDTPNRAIIYDYDGIKYTLPHVENPDTIVKRFALKLLSQMCDLPSGPEQIIHYSLLHLRKIASLLATSQDLFILEYASLTLAKCSTEPVVCDEMIAANILGVLLNHIKTCVDPDVQKNCLQVLIHLLENPNTSAEVIKSSQFSWPPILVPLQSSFPVIQQNALKTLNFLLERYNELHLQKSFRMSTGVLDLCYILERYECRDIHSLVLDTLKTFVATDENSAHLYQTGCVQRVLDYVEVALPIAKSHALSMLSKMSSTVSGRQALFETRADLVFCRHLSNFSNEVMAECAMAIANMCTTVSAARLADTNIVDTMTKLILDDSAAWFDVRINALLAVSVICRKVYKAACTVVEGKHFDALRSVNCRPKKNPVEAQRLALQCYINLQNFNTSTKVMVNEDFISEMIETMQRIDTQLKILAATVLTGLMTEDSAKHIFNNKIGEEVIARNLCIEHVGLRTALCKLIIATVTEDCADIYHAMGTIQYMIENKMARYKVSTWEPAIEAILRYHPSAKLAFTGRLGINDATTEGFYVMKRMGETFQTLPEILELPAPYVDPVLIVKFLPAGQNKMSLADIRSPWCSSNSRLNMESSIQQFDLPDDSNLRRYLLQLKLWFGDPAKSLQYIEIEDGHYDVRYRKKCQEVSTSLKARAQLLGEYVAEQMSGLTQEGDCSLPSVEMHLVDLMLESHCHVVGLGFVKCGGALERAILYKVLADRVGIPCSLHRGTSAYAWVEVTVPEIDPAEELKDERYPAGLLRENYIVDLMGKPGKLIPLFSHEARRICGPPCIPLYVARAAPQKCKCSAREPQEYLQSVKRANRV